MDSSQVRHMRIMVRRAGKESMNVVRLLNVWNRVPRSFTNVIREKAGVGVRTRRCMTSPWQTVSMLRDVTLPRNARRADKSKNGRRLRTS